MSVDPHQLEDEAMPGEILVSETGDVIIGAPTAVAFAVPPEEEE